MARVHLGITDVRTVDAEFREEHAGPLKRSPGKGCLSEGPGDNSECYLATNHAIYSLGKEGLGERSDTALTK